MGVAQLNLAIQFSALFEGPLTVHVEKCVHE